MKRDFSQNSTDAENVADQDDIDDQVTGKETIYSDDPNPLVQEAVEQLRNSAYYQDLKNEASRLADDAQSTQKACLASIPYLPWLVKRMLKLSQLPKTSKRTSVYRTEFQSNKKLYYEFINRITIHGESMSGSAALRRYMGNETKNPHEMVLLVLWALQETLPEVYQQLISTADFGEKQLNVMPEKWPVSGVPVPYDETEPDFVFDGGDMLQRQRIHPSKLLNTFITGATGMGKTYGGVIPLLQSFLAYRNSAQQAMSMLVIDPKQELLAVCESTLRQHHELNRLHILGRDSRMSYFGSESKLSLEDRYRHFFDIVGVKAQGEAIVWQEKGHRLNLDMLEQDRSFSLLTGYSLFSIVLSLASGKNALHESSWICLLKIYRLALGSDEAIRWMHLLISIVFGLFTDIEDFESVLKPFANGNQDMLAQLYYRVSNAEQICNVLGDPLVTNCINTDLYPNDPKACSVDELLCLGKVMLLQTDGSYSGDITGRLVKARFFADVFNRSDMKIPVAFVADEFQRFITADRTTGEQSFLDRCRAYRVNCVLATQSIASIEFALTERGTVGSALATEIIIANTPTKLMFRCTDDMATKHLAQWLPPAPKNHIHVALVRPPSSLKTGYAYFLLDGEWGFYQYKKRTLAPSAQSA